jgi:hypothetical protein
MKPDTYSVTVVWSDEDQAFVTEVSELPGCMAHGESSEQASEQIGVALADGPLWNASHNGPSAIGTPIYGAGGLMRPIHSIITLYLGTATSIAQGRRLEGHERPLRFQRIATS